MAKTIEEQLKKRREQQQRQRERQRAKAIAKANDPVHQEKMRQKKREQQQRAREKQIAKLSSPEYQQKMLQKQAEQRAVCASKPKATKRPASRGLKGRTPNAEEKRIMDALGKLPCIACYNQGRTNPVISLHHNDGRTKPYAHADSLPLCAHHHDTPAEKEVIEQYPDLIPIHAKGAVGGKAQWRKFHGHESVLLKQCYEMADLVMPEALSSRLYYSEQ